MKIKRIEIIGFKSFVDKAVLDFQQGITSVVGPNGCGKSNIVDAIRWVMGEQSAKNLRGSNMEDVIFVGSELRKPLGMAEVSVVFSTDDGRVPAKYLNFHEIQVTRRLYRDGESEYFLNKTPCRLLDISELFMDTGVGARAYSVIEQGKIGMILHAKPEERRFIIEEAAGISKFKARKKIALRKIEVTKQNLLRIGDITSEIKRQMNALQRQAKKAETFRSYREELKEIDLLLSVRHYLTAFQSRAVLDEELSLLKKREAELQQQLQQGELSVEEKKIMLLEEEKGLTQAQEEIFRARTDLQAFENRLEFQKKELANLERHKARLEDEVELLEKQLTDALDEQKFLQLTKGQVAIELAEEEESLQAKEEELSAATSGETEATARLEETRRQLFRLLNEIAQWSNQHTSAARKMESLEERVDRSKRERLTLQEKLDDGVRLVSDLDRLLKEISAGKIGLSEELSLQRGREEASKGKLQALEQELLGQRETLTAKKSRLQSLQELEAQLEGYGQGVRSLFLTDRFRDRFNGTVSDHIETEPHYEIAVEAALGEKLQYVVGAADGDALEALDYLRQTAGGRGAFVLSIIGEKRTVGIPDGSVPLSDAITFTQGFRELLLPLIADTYLVQDVNTALSLARQYSGLMFVTPQGDVISEGGVLAGGATDASHSLIHKKREIKELLRDTDKLAAQVSVLETERNETKQQILATEDEVRGLRQRLHEAEIRFVNCEKDLQRAREEEQRIRERLGVKDVDDDQLREEREALVAEIEDSHRLKDEAEEKKKALEEHLAVLQLDVAGQKESLLALREVVTAMKVRVASLKEKIQAGAKAAERVEELIGGLQLRAVARKEELQKGAEEKEALFSLLSRSDEELKELLKVQLAAEGRYSSAKQRFDLQTEVLREEELRLKGLRRGHDDVRQALGEKELRFAELSMTIQHLAAAVLEKYRVDVQSIAPMYSDSEVDEPVLRRRQADLQRLIDDLGEVNLMAVDEYRQLEERFEFLTSQQADLNDSMQALQQAIQRINRTTKKRFQETFELVNAKFQEVFPRLFCGGKAELRLTNEEDLLETGVEIIAQPPGKKLQNITALSGGEKALTAVALIFSVFLIKPSPFCLLDEVDAPLDDANIGRFNEMVREMSSVSQFIIITHNKTTMAIADTLYGVTMEEPGVSKLVSVKLSQAA